MGGESLTEAIARAIVLQRRIALAWGAGAELRAEWEAVTDRIAVLREHRDRQDSSAVDNLTD